MSNKLMIAAAGAGKTTFLVREAYQKRSNRILITTFTENNACEIKSKFMDLYGYIPGNITVLPWITFLLRHGVRPYQSCYDSSLHDLDIGFLLVSEKSGLKYDGGAHPVYWGEKNFKKYFFSDSNKIYSDKISNFIYKTNKKSGNVIFSRLRKIFDCIYIDEIQDMVGYDLEIIKSLLKEMGEVILVGDPRQCTYSTHNAQLYSKYSEGNIKAFIQEELGKKIICCIDEKTLNVSHRNFKAQCDFASSLYPNFPIPEPCNCAECRRIPVGTINGLFLVRPKDIEHYLQRSGTVQLRWDKSVHCSASSPCFNMGESKGMTFDHSLIYLTDPMIKWVKDRSAKLSFFTRAKFYVALTRARYSVALVWNDAPSYLPEFKIFDPNINEAQPL